MTAHIPPGAKAPGLEVGDSFRGWFESQLGQFRERVNVNTGDLTEATWDGRAIALLFNDASKSLPLANAIWRTFYPFCQPGHSLIIEQNFAHFSTPWTHLFHWRFRDTLEPLLYLPESTSVVFRPSKALMFDRDLSFSDFSDGEIEAASNGR